MFALINVCFIELLLISRPLKPGILSQEQLHRIQIVGKQLTFVLLLAIVCNSAFTQDQLYSQFYPAYLYMNPGFAGAIGEKKISLSYRNQWPGSLTKYENFFASYDQPIDVLHGGIGFVVFNDRAGSGLVNTFSVSAIYAYHLRVTQDFFINAGFQVSFNQRSINADRLIFPDMIDPSLGAILPTQELIGDDHKFYMDYSFGFIGYSDKWYGGAAIFHLTQPIQSNSGAEGSSLKRKYVFHMARNFELPQKSGKSESMVITPHISFLNQGKFQYLNLGALFYLKPLTFGVSARQDFQFDFSSLIFSIGFSNLFMDIAYSYDVYIGNQMKFNPPGGAHEISLSFRLPYDKKSKTSRAINIPRL